MPQIEILPVKPEEIGIITHLAGQIWPVCFADILTPGQIGNLLERIYNHDNLRKELQKGHRFWIAQNSGIPIGYVSAYKENDVIWLKKLYMLPEQQGKGIGSLLLNTATHAFLPASKQSLFVNRDNVDAQRYYTRKGFTRMEEVPVKMGDFDFVDYIYSRQLKT
jgi:GNAT superfamily N-acetyltransferase